MKKCLILPHYFIVFHVSPQTNTSAGEKIKHIHRVAPQTGSICICILPAIHATFHLQITIYGISKYY